MGWWWEVLSLVQCMGCCLISGGGVPCQLLLCRPGGVHYVWKDSIYMPCIY